MRTADIVPAMLATAAATALATGCTSTTEGAATGTTPTTTAPIEVYNPCTELQDQTLTEVGLSPASKDVVTDPPEGPSTWRVCMWRSQDNQHFVTVFSTSHTLEEARTNGDSVNQTPTRIGSREALTFFDKAEMDGSSCYAAMGAAQGSFHVSAAWTIHGDRNRDICDVTTEYATSLESHLPK